MKKFILVACILASLRVNISALSFPSDVLSSSFSEKNTLSPLGFSSRAANDSDTSESLFAELLAFLIIACGVGYYWLNNVRFFDYPYEDDDFVSPADGKYIVRGTLSGLSFTDPGYNRSRFSLDTSLVYLHGFGMGNETRFEGLLFPYAGPCFENLALCNFKKGDFDFTKKGLRDNLRIGGEISLFQTNILSAYFIIQYATWFGNDFSDYKNGCNVGILLRSYPIKPLVIEWRFNAENFPHEFMVMESDLHLGLMIRRYEFFAAWKMLDFLNSGEDESEHFKTLHGCTFGARVYFSVW